jgi:DNA mismatch repair ATPase MutL
MWNKFKGSEWPEFSTVDMDQLPVTVKDEIANVVTTQKIALPQVINTTREIAEFLDTNLPIYRNTSMQLESLITDGFLVTSIPIKLQSLREKKDIVKNFNQCIVWYNEWVDKNQFGNKYSESTLNEISKQEEQKLQLPIAQQNLLQ